MPPPCGAWRRACASAAIRPSPRSARSSGWNRARHSQSVSARLWRRDDDGARPPPSASQTPPPEGKDKNNALPPPWRSCRPKDDRGGCGAEQNSERGSVIVAMFMRGMIFPGGREPLVKGDGVSLREESRAFLTQWDPTWAPDELTKSGYRRRIHRYTREIHSDIAYPFFIFRKDDNALLGGCTLSNVRRGVTQSASLGYLIGAKFARQGIMHTAVLAPGPFVFQPLGLHRLEAACIPGNEPSRGLLLKCGFKEEGRARRYLQINGKWQDHILFALLEDDTRL